MDCDRSQEQASLFSDGELGEAEQILLFEHLHACAACRGFLGSLLRCQRATKREREILVREAEEILPPHPALAAHPSLAAHPAQAGPSSRGAFGSGLRPPGHARTRLLGGGLRIPVGLAIGCGALLLIAGIFLGARIIGRLGEERWKVAPVAQPTVVVVYGLPQVDVVGSQEIR